MKTNILSFSIPELLFLYKTELPDIVFLAQTNDDYDSFKKSLKSYVAGIAPHVSSIQKSAIQRIFDTLEYDHKILCDLSTNKDIACCSFEILWSFLRGDRVKNVHPDFFIDLYFLFKQVQTDRTDFFDKNSVLKQMKRWKCGLDKEVIYIRQQNKLRIINLLIDKIDKVKGNSGKYFFNCGMSHADKIRQIEYWWNFPHFHLYMAIRNAKDLNRFLGNTLSVSTMALLQEAENKRMPFFITPYYLSLLCTNNEYDDLAIRSYVLYSRELIRAYGNIRAWEKEDIVVDNQPNAAGWLLPEGGNIHRRYPEVAILIPESMGRACGGLCAPCQRMYGFQGKRLNFNFEALKPKESWDAKLERLLRYYEEDSQLRDILITGGDALMSQNSTLKKILSAVYKMALRKREANNWRPDGEKFAEIQRVRLGSRLPAYLPIRINDELICILKHFKERGSAIGIRQFIIQTHFESPLEVTPEVVQAVNSLLSAGWLVTNQLVFTAAASRRGHTARLRQILNSIGVICYYTFTVKGFEENYAMYAPNSRSLQEKDEEKVFGVMNTKQEFELLSAFDSPADLPAFIKQFLKKNNLPFLSTDRNVLNLPGIGKSMTFSTIGLTPEGKRVLRFKHDSGRKHSPAIHSMGEIYITENKSIAAYLRQLEEMGENVESYNSIWSYSQGTTEPIFKIYEYPESAFSITSNYTNLSVDYPTDVAI